MLHDSSNFRPSSGPSSSDAESYHRDNRNHHNMNRILSAAIEEQKHRRAHGFLTFNHNSLLDNDDPSYEDDEANRHRDYYREIEYIHQLQNQSNQRLEEEHKRFERSQRERHQRIVEQGKRKRDLALSIIQRRMMKPQPSLKLVDLSNVNTHFKPAPSFDSSIRTSSMLSLSSSPSSSSFNALSRGFEDAENEENQYDPAAIALEIQSSATFDEDEEYSKWDELEIVQADAFDESDHILLSLEEEGLPSPMNRENSNYEQTLCSRSFNGERYQDRFITISKHSY